ncbi:MAG: PucR family transcriptional regulator [Sporichthyaceae bacterium]
MNPDSDKRARVRVSATAARVALSRATLADELAKILAAEIDPLPHDEDMLELLTAATNESVAAGLHVLEHGVDPHSLGSPAAAAQYARRLAQRGIPVSALLRAYRLGSSSFVEIMLAEIAAEPHLDTADAAAASVALLRTTTAYVDTVSEALVLAYEDERHAWAQQHSMARSARIRALLDGVELDLSDTETALGYRLRQNHVAAYLWFDERGNHTDLFQLESAATAAAAACGGVHLLLPTDEASAVLWLGSPEEFDDLRPVTAALTSRSGPAPRVALGRPGYGSTGFRDSHRQAQAARTVALAAGRHAQVVTTFTDVGSIALLCADLDATRIWIADTLGALAIDEENAERLRETVRVFLNLGSSHTAAAERLNLHKNSVQYRVSKAEALRGRPFKADRADVELALRACHALGTTVLRAPS